MRTSSASHGWTVRIQPRSIASVPAASTDSAPPSADGADAAKLPAAFDRDGRVFVAKRSVDEEAAKGRFGINDCIAAKVGTVTRKACVAVIDVDRRFRRIGLGFQNRANFMCRHDEIVLKSQNATNASPNDRVCCNINHAQRRNDIGKLQLFD